MFFKAMIAAVGVSLVSTDAALSQSGAHGPNRQQMIENENARNKAAKARADAAKAAELEAIQKEAAQKEAAEKKAAKP